MSSFNNKIAIVTGAGSGIGKAITVGLAARGVSAVCLMGRDMQKLKRVARSIEKNATRAMCFMTDLTVDEELYTAAKGVLEAFGQVDILIHCAGTISLGAMETSRIEDFDRQYALNVRAPYLLTQTLLPFLKKHQGQIVFVNSTVGLTARENVGQYAATKHALKAISDSLRGEVNPYGVRVLSIYPGQTATPMQENLYRSSPKTYQPEKLMQPNDVAAVVIHSLGLPRTVEVTDIMIRPMQKP
jgi:NADP-dependent 3-hydroxy acid dehydrogenase YdfG